MQIPIAVSYAGKNRGYASGVGGEVMMTYVDFLKKSHCSLNWMMKSSGKSLAVVREQHYKKHTTIVHVDDPGNALYILKSGLVKVTIEDRMAMR